MRHSSVINAIVSLIRSRNSTKVLWDSAEPISLEELKARFVALARAELANNPNQPVAKTEELTFEELWRIFELMEDLEDYPVIS